MNVEESANFAQTAEQSHTSSAKLLDGHFLPETISTSLTNVTGRSLYQGSAKCSFRCPKRKPPVVQGKDEDSEQYTPYGGGK